MSDSPLRVVPNPEKDLAPQLEQIPESSNDLADDDLAGDDLAELRRIIIGHEKVLIENLLERLNNPRVRAREISRALPEAIRLRNEEDESVTEAVTPNFAKAFTYLIEKDPRPIAEAITPLMGPAIRRAIALALSGFIQSIDSTLKHSLSWQGMKWRIEAWRTGKPFGEVALYHMLIYRIEQVFLIHKRTGLLLLHVVADAVETQDAEIVSGMLTAMQDAIKNFGRDSFGTGQLNLAAKPIHTEGIKKLDLGDDIHEIWLEPGAHAVLAAVINGQAPESFRADYLTPAIEAVHLEQSEALGYFDGDPAAFELSRPHLEECLQSRYQGQVSADRFKAPFYLKAAAVLLLSALMVWLFFIWRDNRRWNDYLGKLRSTPGIVITEEGKKGGKRFISGLRDPLAIDPGQLLREQTPIDPNKVAAHWEPYQALQPQFILERSRTLLAPPPGVELKFDGGTLSASGIASHLWIADAQKMSRAIAGVTAFNDADLINEDLKEIEVLRRLIESRVIKFGAGITRFSASQNPEFQDLVVDLKRLIALAPAAGRQVQIEIIGHTDIEGDESNNQRLSNERAKQVLSIFVANGINQDIFSIRGAASKEPVRTEASPADQEFNRSVSLKAELRKPQQARP